MLARRIELAPTIESNTPLKRSPTNLGKSIRWRWSIASGQTPPNDLREWVGEIDVYLFDQLLKGRIGPGMRVLDAGCGSGRNIEYLLRSGADVSAVDTSPEAIAAVRELAAEVAPELPEDNFRVEPVEAMSFDDESFDAVLAIALLHFAPDEMQFHAMLAGLWRVLTPGGLLFARLASSIGIEDRVRLLEGRRFGLPDGSERFLVDEPFLLEWTDRLGATLAEPIKTVNVQNQRCMTTWCIRKARPGRPDYLAPGVNVEAGVRTTTEWEHVNAGRYVAYIEESIEKTTQWAVFEPNGPALWDRFRKTVEGFLGIEWRKGALAGDTPDEAFFVKCDRTTMTQNDIDNGRLICVIGIAPVRPAEFVILWILKTIGG